MCPTASSTTKPPSLVEELKAKAAAATTATTAAEQAKKEREYEHLTSVNVVKQAPITHRLQADLASHYSPHVQDLQEYQKMYKQSLEDPATFFGGKAKQFLNWFKDFDQVYIPDPQTGLPSFENNAWFLNGQLNACYNCVDRHALSNPNKVALIYEADEPGQGYKVTYKELLEQVSQLAQVLKYSMGVQKGDTVAVYMPMIPQTIVTLLAITRIGAVHSVVFAGFSSNSLRDRINNADSKVVITTDESSRGSKIIETKRIVDDALRETPNVKHVLVYKRTKNPKVHFEPNRDLDWTTEMMKYKTYYPCEPVDSEHPLFLLYTSGSTGTPKGLQHSTAGYLLGCLLTMRYTFDTHQADVFFTAGDVGWITGHSYVVYGPLLYGCTSVIFEGTPTYPNHSRYWDIIDEYNVTQFYVAPTALRLLKRAGNSHLENNSLKSLRCLGSVGEPIAAEVWEWYSEQVGKNEIPVIDTYWQTESGSHLVTPLAGGCTPMKPGSASFPFFGIETVILDPNTGEEIKDDHAEGVLAVKRAWPSFARTIWQNHDRYLDTYLNPFKGYYFTGDGCLLYTSRCV